ncbi:hypothetical protein AB0I84_06040 [Streptomyces spectabilis]|uniref:hypothetical protein n=1 Tax=Streptomyces spectabilis TaxID=68270 RepID=UPI0033D3747D
MGVLLFVLLVAVVAGLPLAHFQHLHLIPRAARRAWTRRPRPTGARPQQEPFTSQEAL